jgi:hypothetical protein
VPIRAEHELEGDARGPVLEEPGIAAQRHVRVVDAVRDQRCGADVLNAVAVLTRAPPRRDVARSIRGRERLLGGAPTLQDPCGLGGRVTEHEREGHTMDTDVPDRIRCAVHERDVVEGR